MRQVYAHQAVIRSLKSPAAPGAAVTVALCGHWEHEPPCPLAAHHTAVAADGDDGWRVRVLFATEPHRVEDVRSRLDEALSTGDWELISSGCTRMDTADRSHARRLLRTNRARSQ
ncbi:hypothetical protein [Actinoplanes sp. DH11]|uniref:hypothetical protein n=1 Tax=Actinoplanes sp. DH11 TaxID=2857011 RepID=UPI001E5633D8|nr:hypothetical protein [Actinoplanes sp. DH11]